MAKLLRQTLMANAEEGLDILVEKRDELHDDKRIAAAPMRVVVVVDVAARVVKSGAKHGKKRNERLRRHFGARDRLINGARRRAERENMRPNLLDVKLVGWLKTARVQLDGWLAASAASLVCWHCAD